MYLLFIQNYTNIWFISDLRFRDNENPVNMRDKLCWYILKNDLAKKMCT